VEVVIGIVIFGLLGFGFYWHNFGWWKKTRVFDRDRVDQPSLEAFVKGGPGRGSERVVDAGGRSGSAIGRSVGEPTGSIPVGSLNRHSADWFCAECGVLNRDGRPACWSCRAAKPELVPYQATFARFEMGVDPLEGGHAARGIMPLT